MTLNFTSFPGTKDCLKGLTKLCCDSNIHPECFYHLSQICHNIQSLIIYFEEVTSDGLADLISAQQNLKYLNVVHSDLYGNLTADIIISLTNLPDSLIKLQLYGYDHNIPLSFITKLTNLQEMTLAFNNQIYLEDFKKLQYTTFSHLQVLKFQFECPRDELLIKFLENNGKNLKEIYIDDGINDSINLAIAKFCPNLRKLFTGFKNNELETLKMILNSCQYLESIKVWCCDDYLNEKELFEVFVKYSPKNFHELKFCYFSFEDAYSIKSELLPEELESFLISWSDRVPQKSLSLITIRNDSINRTLDEIDGNMEIIEEYTELGTIREFKTIKHCLDDFEY